MPETKKDKLNHRTLEMNLISFFFGLKSWYKKVPKDNEFQQLNLCSENDCQEPSTSSQ